MHDFICMIDAPFLLIFSIQLLLNEHARRKKGRRRSRVPERSKIEMEIRAKTRLPFIGKIDSSSRFKKALNYYDHQHQHKVRRS